MIYYKSNSQGKSSLLRCPSISGVFKYQSPLAQESIKLYAFLFPFFDNSDIVLKLSNILNIDFHFKLK